MSRMQTLDDFITHYRPEGFAHARAHVREPGFTTLYVRLGPRYIGKELLPRVLDLASIEVQERLRGRGRLKGLLHHLITAYPDLPIYFENVQRRELAGFLRRLPGVEEVAVPGELAGVCPCFIWRPA